MAAASKALLVFALLLAAAFIHVASAEETHDDHDGGDHDPSPSPDHDDDPPPSSPDHDGGHDNDCKGKGCCDWSGGDCKHYCDGHDDSSCCDDWSGDCHKCCSK
uniref:Bowman-Birk serine protease inhibitors family domain-containing protein n=1 Tax=Oryza punctata TaxID=4537 RepID=A0A0E0K1M8_ORYPU